MTRVRQIHIALAPLNHKHQHLSVVCSHVDVVFKLSDNQTTTTNPMLRSSKFVALVWIEKWKMLQAVDRIRVNKSSEKLTLAKDAAAGRSLEVGVLGGSSSGGGGNTGRRRRSEWNLLLPRVDKAGGRNRRQFLNEAIYLERTKHGWHVGTRLVERQIYLEWQIKWVGGGSALKNAGSGGGCVELNFGGVGRHHKATAALAQSCELNLFCSGKVGDAVSTFTTGSSHLPLLTTSTCLLEFYVNSLLHRHHLRLPPPQTIHFWPSFARCENHTRVSAPCSFLSTPSIQYFVIRRSWSPLQLNAHHFVV